MRTDTPSSRVLAEQIASAKDDLRERARAARKERSPRRLEEAALSIADHLAVLPQFAAAGCASVYVSRPHEPGTGPLISRLAEQGTRVLVPMLGDGLQRGWAEFRDTSDLVERAPGRPPEPSSPFLPSDALADADVIVVPALGVDVAGTRLGQGGGWYDRALTKARAGAIVVAAVFDAEWHAGGEPLPREEHDVPVHAAVTPSGLRLVAAA